MNNDCNGRNGCIQIASETENVYHRRGARVDKYNFNFVAVLAFRWLVHDYRDLDSILDFGKFNYAVIMQGGLILGAVLIENLDMSYVLPVSQCDMNLSTKEKGILSGVGFAGMQTGRVFCRRICR